MDLYDHDWQNCRHDIKGYSFSDAETKEAMRQVFQSYQYMLDPHGAIGYLGLQEYLKTNSGYTGIFLETAHPGKFREVVEETIQQPLELPEVLQKFMTSLFSGFKAYLLNSL